MVIKKKEKKCSNSMVLYHRLSVVIAFTVKHSQYFLTEIFNAEDFVEELRYAFCF